MKKMKQGELKNNAVRKVQLKQGKLDNLTRLGQEHLYGVWWTMSDLEKRIGREKRWIKKHILLQPKFRAVLDIDNGGFVFYPKNKNQQWAFQARKMAKFLDENFAEIHKQF